MPPLEYRGGSHTPAHPSTTTRLLDFYFGPTATARYNYHFTGVTTIINYENPRPRLREQNPRRLTSSTAISPPAAAEAVPKPPCTPHSEHSPADDTHNLTTFDFTDSVLFEPCIIYSLQLFCECIRRRWGTGEQGERGGSVWSWSQGEIHYYGF